MKTLEVEFESLEVYRVLVEVEDDFDLSADGARSDLYEVVNCVDVMTPGNVFDGHLNITEVTEV